MKTYKYSRFMLFYITNYDINIDFSYDITMKVS